MQHGDLGPWNLLWMCSATVAGLEPARVLEAGFAAQRQFAARVEARDVEPWPVLRFMRTHEAALSDLEWARDNLQ